MPKRIFWMTTGYAAGAASSWAVQRKVKREVERVLPTAVRNEVSNRVSLVGDQMIERTVNSPVAQSANKAIKRVRPDIDLTDRAQARLDARQPPELTLVEEEQNSQPGITRLRDCLLYTSPSPRDKRQSRMPSSA